jgi:putative transcriptional regulator
MTSLAGRILIAMPAMGDPRFHRAVVLVCAHSDDYAMGLVLNNPIERLSVSQLLDQLDIAQDIHLPEQAVLNGGPVGTDRGFVVHSGDYFCDGATIEVGETLCMTATRDVLRALAQGGAPRMALLTLGYAGWGPRQLETEIAGNCWIVSDPDEALIFDHGYATKWNRSLKKMGVTPALLHHGGEA